VPAASPVTEPPTVKLGVEEDPPPPQFNCVAANAINIKIRDKGRCLVLFMFRVLSRNTERGSEAWVNRLVVEVKPPRKSF